MSKPTIQVPVTFDSANRKKDKSVGIKFTTNYEVSNKDFAQMDLNVGAEGWLLFKPNEFLDADIPKEDAPAEGKKPSQRLRAVLWHYWDQQTDKSEDFDHYYQGQMEKIITTVKDKLV